MKKVYADLSKGIGAGFKNNSAFCVGTGRMDLALMKEYNDELKMVQELCGFKHIRGHGIFCERMGIYRLVKDPDGTEHVSYNFTYLDRVMDSYLEAGLEPFIELGFMPPQIASGTQTIFWWKGNTTPPSDHSKWSELVKATLRHLIERYGERAVTWPVEVWNEPNLPGFWENHDRKKYLELYRVSSLAVKEVDPRIRVGGPAICGGGDSLEWVHDFLAFCRDEKLPVDFLTRHAYMGEEPSHVGKYLYHTMSPVAAAMKPLTDTREIIDSFPEFNGMEMHITEFNTSYNPYCPIHDTNMNAAIIAHWLSKLGDVAASYSYWTFGDVFEEQDIPSRPFHGGFGMVAGDCIAKPTLWTFVFYNRLNGTPLYRDDNCVITRESDGSICGVLWNDSDEETSVNVALENKAECAVLLSDVSPSTCNPLKCWHEMGEPASLTKAQVAFLRDAGRPLNSTRRVKPGENLSIMLEPGAVVYFSAKECSIESDYGYDYNWYVK